MYIEMPRANPRLDDLARKIGAFAEAIAKLREYASPDNRHELTEEEELVADFSRSVFDRYCAHVEEYDALFIKHMQEFEMWRKSVQDNSGLVVHMGPIMPASERYRPPAPSSSKGFEPPAWSLTEEELAEKSQSELEKVLSGNL